MAIALVQQKLSQPTGATSFVNVVLDATPTNGNTLILTLRRGTTTNVITSITQTGATWSKATQVAANSDSEIWYSTAASSASATVKVTFTSSASVTGTIINVSEWSGFSGSVTLDVSNTASGTSQNPTSPSITTTKANELLIAALSLGSTVSVSPPDSSFTALSATDTNAAFAYRIVGSTGTYSTTWPTNSSSSWDSTIAGFNAGLSNSASLAGTVTPAATLAKKTTLKKTGGITPLGVLAQIGHAFFTVLQGAITPTGGLATHKTSFKQLAGTITPTAIASLLSTIAPYNWGAFRDSKNVAWPSWYHNNAHRRERRPG